MGRSRLSPRRALSAAEAGGGADPRSRMRRFWVATLAFLMISNAVMSAEQPATKVADVPVLGDVKHIVSGTVDCQGNVWLGSEDKGAWRIAGQEKKQFTTADGLGDNDAYALACDARGRIWAGHSSHGVSVFDGSHWRNYDVTKGPCGSRVFCIATCPADGGVWIATDSGLTRYSLKNDTWSSFDRSNGLPADQANGVAFDAQGNVYVGLQCAGIAMASAGEGYAHWHSVTGPDVMPKSATGDGLPGPLINVMRVSRQGTIYAGTTRGLAYSSDRGKTWAYTRGSDWAQLAKGSYDGAPPDMVPSATVLKEDWITCMAEGPDGVLWVGHRDQGYEAIQIPSLRNLAEGPGNVRSLIPMASGGLIVGTYGKGALKSGATQFLATATPPAATQPAATRNWEPPALPSPTAPPNQVELERMLARVRAMAPAQREVEALTDDWQTKGDWPGRYGHRYALVSGYAWNRSTVAAMGYSAFLCAGPWRRDANVFSYGTGNIKSNENSPFDPANRGRRNAEFNDGSWQAKDFPRSLEGPDLYVALTLPQGIHRVSLFFFNFDGQKGANADREYYLQVKSTTAKVQRDRDDESSPLVDDVRSAGASSFVVPGWAAIDAELSETIAAARVPHFVQPVYKRFLIRGAGTHWIKIGRNHSFVTKFQGLFVDDEGGSDKAGPSPIDVQGLASINVPVPAESGQHAGGALGAAIQLWAELDASPGKEGYEQVCWPMRLAAYRAALAAGADAGLLANWRWHLGIWTQADRDEIHHYIDNAPVEVQRQ